MKTKWLRELHCIKLGILSVPLCVCRGEKLTLVDRIFPNQMLCVFVYVYNSFWEETFRYFKIFDQIEKYLIRICLRRYEILS